MTGAASSARGPGHEAPGGAPSPPSGTSPEPPLPVLRRLLPGGADAGAREIVGAFDLPARAAGDGAARPWVALNMVATADGRATVGGRSGTISGRADRALFHALRGVVDGVLVGAGTARAERYGRLVRDPGTRAERVAAGRAAEPLVCVVSARLALDAQRVPLLGERDARVAILTASDGHLPAGYAARIEYVRAERDGALDLGAALEQLRQLGVGTLLCEGGPHLNAQLLAGGLVDELFLSLSPLLAGGGEQMLRIVCGPELAPPARMRLVTALEHDSHLFLRYAID